MAALTPAVAQGNYYHHINNGWHMMNYGYGGIVMWILLIVGIAILVYLIAGLPKSEQGEKRPHETALEILRKRYARGEISKEEFDRMKHDLQP